MKMRTLVRICESRLPNTIPVTLHSQLHGATSYEVRLLQVGEDEVCVLHWLAEDHPIDIKEIPDTLLQLQQSYLSSFERNDGQSFMIWCNDAPCMQVDITAVSPEQPLLPEVTSGYELTLVCSKLLDPIIATACLQTILSYFSSFQEANTLYTWLYVGDTGRGEVLDASGFQPIDLAIRQNRLTALYQHIPSYPPQ